MHIYYIYYVISTFQYITKLQQKGYKRMKKMKRILALALALTLCLGLAATVFAALPSYDVIASRMSMSDSLNENDDILVGSGIWILKKVQRIHLSCTTAGSSMMIRR